MSANSRTLAQHGYLGLVVDETEDGPSSSSYRSRFSSLLRTYSLIGHRPDQDYGYVEERTTSGPVWLGII